MLKIGDKIKYVKADPFVEMPLGTILTVTDINGTALAIEGDYKVDGCVVGRIKGIMSYNKYEEHFEKVIKTNTTEWSKWENLDLCGDKLCEECRYECLCHYENNHLDKNMQYRHNNKKVQVKAKLMPCYLYPNAPEGKVLTACASCHPDDTFNIKRGIDIALTKLNKKIAQKVVEMTNENLKGY